MTPDAAVSRLLLMVQELPDLVAEAQRRRAILRAARFERGMGRRLETPDGDDPYDAARLAQANVDLCVAAIGSFLEVAVTGGLGGRALIGRDSGRRGRHRG